MAEGEINIDNIIQRLLEGESQVFQFSINPIISYCTSPHLK